MAKIATNIYGGVWAYGKLTLGDSALVYDSDWATRAILGPVSEITIPLKEITAVAERPILLSRGGLDVTIANGTVVTFSAPLLGWRGFVEDLRARVAAIG